MARKKKGETTTTRKKTVYELVGENRPPIRRGVDPLDDILIDEERELSREVKRIRLEQIVMKRRRELQRMKEGGEMEMGTLPSNTDFLNMARFMSELTPEEAQRVRSAYSFFKMSEKSGGGGMQLLPMMLNYARQNPGASEGQMVTYLKLMDSQFSKGLELAKAVNPAKADASAMEFLKIMKDLVIEGVRNPLLQAIKESQPQPGVFEQILTRPELFSRAKEIGMFGSSDKTSTEYDLKIEELRGERMMSMKRLELEVHRDELKRQAEDRKMETLLAAFVPIATAFAGPMSQRMNEFGKQQAYAHNPNNPGPPPGETTPQENMVHLLCTCGFQGPANLEPGQTEIPCPECGERLTVKIPETPQTGGPMDG